MISDRLTLDIVREVGLRHPSGEDTERCVNRRFGQRFGKADRQGDRYRQTNNHTAYRGGDRLFHFAYSTNRRDPRLRGKLLVSRNNARGDSADKSGTDIASRLLGGERERILADSNVRVHGYGFCRCCHNDGGQPASDVAYCPMRDRRAR